jgi:hypothetical protein
MTVQCCVCRKYRVDDRWKKNADIDGSVSHTYCPVCKKEAMKSFNSNKKELAPAK